MTAPGVFVPYKERARPSIRSGLPGLIAWLGPEFANIQRTNPGQYVAPWPNASIRSLSARVAEMGVSITDFTRSSRLGDGITDATTAAQDATDAAIESGVGIVYYPPGRYRMTDSIVNSTSVTHFTFANPAGGIGGRQQTDAVILHDFVGHQFVFNGADGQEPGTGGGVMNLRISNMHGAPGDLCGSAIWFGAIDLSHHVSNSMVSRCLIAEDSGTGAFDYALEFDFHNSVGAYGLYGSADFKVDHCLTHTSGTGALRCNAMASSSFDNCQFFDVPGSDMVIGDVDPSTEITFDNILCAGTLVTDRVSALTMYGGGYTAITNTSNCTNQCNLFPGKLVTPFVDNSGGLMNVVYFDGTNALVTNAGVRIQGAGTWYSGSGVPSNAMGADGDAYLRTGTPATPTQVIYNKQSGAWVGIL